MSRQDGSSSKLSTSADTQLSLTEAEQNANIQKIREDMKRLGLVGSPTELVTKGPAPRSLESSPGVGEDSRFTPLGVMTTRDDQDDGGDNVSSQTSSNNKAKKRRGKKVSKAGGKRPSEPESVKDDLDHAYLDSLPKRPAPTASSLPATKSSAGQKANIKRRDAGSHTGCNCCSTSSGMSMNFFTPKMYLSPRTQDQMSAVKTHRKACIAADFYIAYDASYDAIDIMNELIPEGTDINDRDKLDRKIRTDSRLHGALQELFAVSMPKFKSSLESAKAWGREPKLKLSDGWEMRVCNMKGELTTAGANDASQIRCTGKETPFTEEICQHQIDELYSYVNLLIPHYAYASMQRTIPSKSRPAHSISAASKEETERILKYAYLSAFHGLYTHLLDLKSLARSSSTAPAGMVDHKAVESYVRGCKQGTALFCKIFDKRKDAFNSATAAGKEWSAAHGIPADWLLKSCTPNETGIDESESAKGNTHCPIVKGSMVGPGQVCTHQHMILGGLTDLLEPVIQRCSDALSSEAEDIAAPNVD